MADKQNWRFRSALIARVARDANPQHSRLSLSLFAHMDRIVVSKSRTSAEPLETL
jgi:hypothetical protein